MPNTSLWSFISQASPVVQCVMLILFATSIASWTIIIQRTLYFKQLRRSMQTFEHHFWSGIDLTQLFQQLSKKNQERFALSHIFYAGFKEFRHSALLDNTKRAMSIATTQEVTQLEKHLGFLATVGSTSPYVGLFGTVWGIMSAFRALGIGGQASIAMVAPGIAEALIATAIGLFAAIPAVIAYNRFSHTVDQIETQYGSFQEELTNLFNHQTHQTHPKNEKTSV